MCVCVFFSLISAWCSMVLMHFTAHLSITHVRVTSHHFTPTVGRLSLYMLDGPRPDDSGSPIQSRVNKIRSERNLCYQPHYKKKNWHGTSPHRKRKNWCINSLLLWVYPVALGKVFIVSSVSFLPWMHFNVPVGIGNKQKNVPNKSVLMIGNNLSARIRLDGKLRGL